MWARTCLLLAWAASLGWCLPWEEEEPLRRLRRDQQPIFGITHLDIRDAILALDRSIKGVASKLNRHEARESQLGGATTNALQVLNAKLTETGTAVQVVARQLVKTEERLLSIEALIQTTDERQRMMLGQLTQGLDRVLAQEPALDSLPPLPDADLDPQQESAVLKVVKKLNRKVSGVELMIQRDMRVVTDEVKSVGQALNEHAGQLQGRHDRLQNQLVAANELTQTSLQELSDTVTASTVAIQEQVQSQGGNGGCGSMAGDREVFGSCLEALTNHSRRHEETFNALRDETKQTLGTHLTTLQTVLQETHAAQDLLNTSIDHITKSLDQLTKNTQGGLGELTSDLREAVKADVSSSVGALERKLLADNEVIADMFEDLKEVERVMIHTADSVLDTKRSIEFGIKQIIIELGDIVKNSDSEINTTLSDQINKISSSILKNQTTALKNMTVRMEQEISQVWRQIGIMYQQMSQSADILGELQDTTKEHMNASLSRVGNMDGTVGKINSKVADVESNLNSLLGRLSLVVSEFTLMKYGVEEELNRLRDTVAEVNNPVEFAQRGEPSSASQYEVNR